MRAGLQESIIAAISHRAQPTFENARTKRVFDVVSELCEASTLSSASYAAAVDDFGVQTLVELVSLTGFYVMIGLLLNTFEADPPEGAMLLAP